MAAQTDLWGDIAPTAERTPLSILREQAALLGTKTKNLVEAKVEISKPPYPIEDTLHYSFVLVVPPLDNYRYTLFTVSYRIASLYPVSVTDRRLATEEQFIVWLRDKLSSPETKKLIGNLLAQVVT